MPDLGLHFAPNAPLFWLLLASFAGISLAI